MVRMPLQNVEQIFAAVDANVPTPFVFDRDTKIVILDSFQEASYELNIPENELETLNSLHEMAQGTYLYDLANPRSPPSKSTPSSRSSSEDSRKHV